MRVRWLRFRLWTGGARRVRAHLTTDQTLEGVLVGIVKLSGEKHYLLDHASLLDAPGRTSELDGRQYIHLTRVVWLQEA